MTVLEPAAPQETLPWLIDILGGPVDGPSIPMLARPDAAGAELLIPLASSGVTAAAVVRRHDGRNPRQRAATTLARAAARVGQIQRVGGEIIQFPRTALLAQMTRVLGRTELIPSIGLGPPRRNRKPLIMLITPDGETVAYAKVGWSGLTRELVRNESKWLTELDGRPAPPVVVPAPLLTLEATSSTQNDTRTLVMSPLLGTAGRRQPRLTPAEVKTLARTLGSRQQRVADLQWLRAPVTQPEGSADVSDELGQRLMAAVSAVADLHAGVEVETGLWHGDLNPWNTVTVGANLGVFDWEFAGSQRPIGQDNLHIQFETIRRSNAAPPEDVVDEFVAQVEASPDPLRPVLLDVYLADLTLREARLSGQGWDGPMARYRQPLTRMLERRVAK